MVKIQVLLGSTRPGRVGEQVARWVYEVAKQRSDMEAEYVDLADYHLPLLDEPKPASTGIYSKDHTKKWAETIARADGYIFVTGEYNHSVPAALKNAIDFLNHEWNHKAVAFVSYGSSANGNRAVEHLRQIVGEVRMADIRSQVSFSLAQDFEQYTTFKQPNDGQYQLLQTLLDELALWSEAMQAVRAKLKQTA